MRFQTYYVVFGLALLQTLIPPLPSLGIFYILHFGFRLWLQASSLTIEVVGVHSCLQEPSACELALDHIQFLWNENQSCKNAFFSIGHFPSFCNIEDSLWSLVLSLCHWSSVIFSFWIGFRVIPPAVFKKKKSLAIDMRHVQNWHHQGLLQLKSKKHHKIGSFQGFREGADMIKS